MAPSSLPPLDAELGGVVGSHNGSGVRLALVAARWNQSIADRLLDGALRAFGHCNVARRDVLVAWAPGAFELPTVCQQLASSSDFDAVIALGAVIRGETAHADLISDTCARGVSRASARSGRPVIFGVITCDTEDQALARSGDEPTNRGFEAVVTAVEMVTLLRQLPGALPLDLG